MSPLDQEDRQSMCGFFVTNRRFESLGHVNEYIRYRGPDATRHATHNRITFCHSLLSITGDVRPQPFLDDSGDVVCVFNGEIYNYRSFGSYTTDGDALIPLYKEHGTEFTRHLDGEFALVLVDFVNNVLVYSTDAFATKPLWYAFENGDFAFASYKSALDRLNFLAPARQAANSTSVVRLSDKHIASISCPFDFDPTSQFKKDYDDWIRAFESSIRKRTTGLREKLFIGLSSGYDSGAIACELTKQAVEYKAFSIEGAENVDIIRRRHELEHSTPEYIIVDEAQYLAAREHVSRCCEDFEYQIRVNGLETAEQVVPGLSLRADPASYALASVCARARLGGHKVYLSGQGSDEIISDYGENGRKIYPHSSFGGRFPPDLAAYFPWPSFYGSTQMSYLAKEEYVLGSFGMEARYPFLDPTLVQEFLWLDVKLKNAQYKAPLHMYLWLNDYPFERRKIGFNCGATWKQRRVYRQQSSTGPDDQL